jgi:hypothetical protein
MTGLSHRLKRLELEYEACKPHCVTCGYPQRAVRSIFHSQHSGPLNRCRSCNQPLDDAGIPLRTPLVRIMRGTRRFDVNTGTRS